IYYDQFLNITTFYYNMSNGAGIDPASLNLTVLVNNTMFNMVNNGNGNYSWIFSGVDWYQTVTTLPYNFTMKINATAPGYQYFERYITIQIMPRPTNITVYLNESITNELTMYFGEQVLITAYYHENLSYYGIDGASVNISQVEMTEDLLNIGNYTYVYNATLLGNYPFIINGTKHGYAYAETSLVIHVIERPTRMRIYIDSVEIYNTTTYFNESHQIVAHYYDVLTGTGIDTAVLNITNSGIWELAPVPAEQGNYSIRYNFTTLTDLTFVINGSKYGYEFNSTHLLISVLPRLTSIIAYFNESQTYDYLMYLNQTLDLVITYYDVRLGVGISNAVVNLTMNPTWQLNETPALSGNYSLIYYAGTIMNYTIVVNASHYGYVYNSTIMNLEVRRRPVDLSVNLNATIGTDISIKSGETVDITLTFLDSLTGEGIENAMVNISWNPSYIGYTDANGNYTYTFNETTPGDYEITIRVEKDGFVILDQTITIHVQELPPKGGESWIFIVVALVAVSAVAVIGIYRQRSKKRAKPRPPKEKIEEVVEEKLPKAIRAQLKELKEKSLMLANKELGNNKYLDAVISYEMAARAAKRLGESENYKNYTKKCEEILLFKRELIEKIEKEQKITRKDKSELQEVEEIKEKEVSSQEFKDKIDKILEDTKMTYIGIIDAAQNMGISVEKAKELAAQAKYRITKSRIYKQETGIEEPERFDDFTDLDDLESAIEKEKEGELTEEVEKPPTDEKLNKFNEFMSSLRTSYINLSKAAEKMGISIEEVKDLAEKEGYRTTKARIYKK
ncbi:MAG: hypothetical protein ACTSQ8_19805, partial [Candidatus Helarchaeota archaeon]